ncbi:hypothetical protein DFS34DRAFT_632211 [Phlyctochytrium arcticum]|nr:hypothetical protein DFS34DRAFT_632211 [Phlyctochytrium arcticum]
MGNRGNKRSRFKRVNYDKKVENPATRTDSKYSEIKMENAMFEEYYRRQSLMDGEEFTQFLEMLRVILPTSFRITGSRSHAAELKDLMIKEYFPDMEDFEMDGEKVQVPRPLSWYPDDLAWQSNLPRTALRRNPQLAKFHRFLVAETEVGNISRQEIVSMIPVLLMDIKPGHAVLDMCAAPGSKTAQIIEALHSDETNANPDGLIIANDADQARSHMLVKQAKRLQSPCLMVTNHEAQQFPNIRLGGNGEPKRTLQFDRILADVPCSGDGTMRKNMLIWKSWNQNNGNALHRVQLPILLRGCALLKVGGRIVYSTCSFNPLENEAIVAAALNHAGGSMRLVDVSAELPELKRRPGLATWTYQSKSGQYYSKLEDVPHPDNQHIQASMFPPANASELNLERCLRVYPHLQNTGGFFVAVLEKVQPFGSIDKPLANEPEDDDQEQPSKASNDSEDSLAHGLKRPATDQDSLGEAESKRSRSNEPAAASPETGAGQEAAVPNKLTAAWTGRESPFVFIDAENADVTGIRKFFGLADAFPKDQFVVRSENEQFRTIYFVSSLVKAVVTAPNSFRLNIVNTGIRIFTRNAGNDAGAECPFRLTSEGLFILGPFLAANRVIQAPLADMVTLLSREYPKFTEFGDHVRESLSRSSLGSCIIMFDPTTEANYTGSVKTKVHLPIWRAHVSVSLLLNKQERKSLMHRLTGEELSIEQGLDKKPDVAIKEPETEMKTDDLPTEQVLDTTPDVSQSEPIKE